MKFQLYKPQAIHEFGSRPNQEDRIYPAAGQATAEDRLFVVCDGMGGHEKGEVASAAVCEAISTYLKQNWNTDEPLTDELFQQALAAAFDLLDAKDDGAEKKMGTTLTFACFHRGGVLVAHIGDSRIYHLRPATGEILYRSRDHSLVHQLYELGEISYRDMKTAKNKNVILRAMQPKQETRTKADLVHITDIKPGDNFYMCSDGMLETMEDEDLMAILSAKDLDDDAKRAKLIEVTEGNSDNHSAYLIHVEKVEAEEIDATMPNDEPAARAANKALNDPDKDKFTVEEEDDSADVEIVKEGLAVEPDTTSQPAPQTSRPHSAAGQQPYAQPKPAGKKSTTTLLILALLVAAIAGTLCYLFLFNDKKDEVKEPERIIINSNESTDEAQQEDVTDVAVRRGQQTIRGNNKKAENSGRRNAADNQGSGVSSTQNQQSQQNKREADGQNAQENHQPASKPQRPQGLGGVVDQQNTQIQQQQQNRKQDEEQPANKPAKPAIQGVDL